MFGNVHFQRVIHIVFFAAIIFPTSLQAKEEKEKLLPPTGGMQVHAPLLGRLLPDFLQRLSKSDVVATQLDSVTPLPLLSQPRVENTIPLETTVVTAPDVLSPPISQSPQPASVPPLLELEPRTTTPTEGFLEETPPAPKAVLEEAESPKEFQRSVWFYKAKSFFFERKKETQTSEPKVAEISREDIQITIPRVPMPLSQSGRSISVVTAKEIEAQGSYTLGEALRNIPGTRIRTLGSLGDQTTIQFRGTRSFDTVVLINGMPLRDAADPQGSATPIIQDLFTDQFEQVEVLRGTGSTLYGSEAIGGVVNLKMKQGLPGRPRAKLIYDGGTNGTHRQTYQVSGGAEMADYFLQYGHIASDGTRAADAYGADVYSLNAGVKPLENVEARFILNAKDGSQNLNDSPQRVNGVLFQDQSDPNSLRFSRFLHYIVDLEHHPFEPFNHGLKYGFVDSDRRFINGRDTVDRSFSDSQFDSNTSNLEYQANLEISEHFSVTTGLEHEREELIQFVSEVRNKFAGYRLGSFSEGRASFFDKALIVTAGGRLTHHKRSHTNQSGELSATYHFRPTDTQFKGHFGTGFREPSLYELFGRVTSGGFVFNFGNPNLKPEKTISWDAGIVQNLWNGAASLAATFFKNEYSRRIVFINGGYNPREGGYSQGAELEVKWRPLKSLSFGSGYTRTFSEADGASITGLPRHLWSLNADWQFLNRFQYHLDLTHRGNEEFQVFSLPTFTTATLHQGSYTKVDMKLTFDMSDSWKLWVRADNLFNALILEGGFRNPGAQFFGGVSVEV